MMYNDKLKEIDNSDTLNSDEVVRNVSSELVNDQAAQQKTEAEFMENFMKEHFKHIAVGEISSADRAKLNDALNLLSSLKAEVVSKKIGSLEKKDFIKAMVAKLKSSDRVNIDEEEFNKTEQSVIEFVALLDKMIAEIDADIVFYTKLLSDTPPAHVMAYKDEADDFKHHLDMRISSIKKYAKNAKRDLAVSYSRYCFGFDAQMRQIAYVEHVLRHEAKNTEKKNSEEI